ncbi:hypothetical protein [Rubrivirga marina]|uniref:Uncharacterized protein n=1 Tax=Rubrivirga marina TaxID=1196024 RepID=A0A271IXY2_9BACT|nr:hypothetical protein [Rubrivirga marina]PAP75990.1 hypothetical protein BSZ37_05805 [Rubrivirga marina]
MPIGLLLRTLSLAAAIVGTAASAQPAAPGRATLDAALDAMEARGYYASRVDWPAVRARAYEQTADA